MWVKNWLNCKYLHVYIKFDQKESIFTDEIVKVTDTLQQSLFKKISLLVS